MAAVMIGVDPHKASHTAVAIGAAEEPLGELRVRASATQAERLLGWGWAAAWEPMPPRSFRFHPCIPCAWRAELTSLFGARPRGDTGP
jgi:hypothetical protein